MISLSSCVNYKNLLYLQDENQRQNALYQEKPIVPYLVRENDNLFIRVNAFESTTMDYFNQGSLTGNASGLGLYFSGYNYTVNEKGKVELPVIGEMEVLGKTTKQIQDEIDSKLESYLQNPATVVRLSNWKVTLVGEFNAPGTLNIYDQQVTILQALGLAGDFTDYADLTQVQLIREKETGVREVYYIDMTRPNLATMPYFYVQPDDVIYAPALKAKAFNVNSGSIGVILSSISIAVLIANTTISIIQR